MSLDHRFYSGAETNGDCRLSGLHEWHTERYHQIIAFLIFSGRFFPSPKILTAKRNDQALLRLIKMRKNTFHGLGHQNHVVANRNAGNSNGQANSELFCCPHNSAAVQKRAWFGKNTCIHTSLTSRQEILFLYFSRIQGTSHLLFPIRLTPSPNSKTTGTP